VTAWLWIFLIAGLAGAAVWMFASLSRAAGHEMPPYPEPRPWQPDPSRFGRCPSCGTHRPLEDGLIAAHDRPEPQVPFNVQTFPCRGAGQTPIQAKASER
jgi:uncharacterized membrane protein